MSEQNQTPEATQGIPEDENRLVAVRRAKLVTIRAQGIAFPNDFRRDALAQEIHGLYGKRSGESLEQEKIEVKLAGRVMAKRVMGKASFAQIQDMSGRIQLFVQKEIVGEADYEMFKTLDLGDIVGAEGALFRTKTGELSVRVERLRLLTKSLRPLPEKWHGITDQEARFRSRELDLIMNEEARQVFATRVRVLRFIRDFFDTLGFMEVETPMLHPIPGGAAARPFKTHYNALDHDFYLRIAPELYLKRLVVGGLEKVYEINRSFRNEGLSTRHNPEFTMLEFYQAYVDYHDLMNLTETLLRDLVQAVKGDVQFSYQGQALDFGQPFVRLSVREAVLKQNPQLDASRLDERAYLADQAKGLGVAPQSGWGAGKLLLEIFEKTVEHKLVEPTFITEYPTEVSPLARRNDTNPEVTDRFEFFVGGRELANGFSELNDAEDQAERFEAQAQAKDAGDAEAMFYDEAYIHALEYGLPPTAGEGIGIDRLVMLLTDSPSIREVLLFPQLRPEA
jgi:lysyl-tRNA synthetase class 2